MKVLGIIPARYGSTRFPGKPLTDILGKPMIQWVYENALKSELLHHVVVATDDDRIIKAVKAFGGDVMMTSTKHQTGTERCAAIAEKLIDFELLINIQGDEPLIDPKQIDTLVALFNTENIQLGTLIKSSSDINVLNNSNKIKVVVDQNNKALYFSRSAIPFNQAKLDEFHFFKHLGMYGYRRATLLEIAKLSPSDLEKTESLEQLRWMEHGYSIHTAETQIECHSVDVPEDVALIIEQLNR